MYIYIYIYIYMVRWGSNDEVTGPPRCKVEESERESCYNIY